MMDRVGQLFFREIKSPRLTPPPTGLCSLVLLGWACCRDCCHSRGSPQVAMVPRISLLKHLPSSFSSPEPGTERTWGLCSFQLRCPASYLPRVQGSCDCSLFRLQFPMAWSSMCFMYRKAEGNRKGAGGGLSVYMFVCLFLILI